MKTEMKYRQLAMFSVIVLEVVVTPSVLGGAVFYFCRGQSNQVIYSALAAALGLAIAFYRIGLLHKKWSKNDHE
jgi:hypothetical protein